MALAARFLKSAFSNDVFNEITTFEARQGAETGSKSLQSQAEVV